MTRTLGDDATRSETPLTPLEFRRVLGHLPTGVTILSAFRGAGAPVGMTANSVTSVSLDPPLILVCPAKSSTTWPEIRAAGHFCVNVMARHHEPLCRRFAATSAARFAGTDWRSTGTGPALTDAIAWLHCEILAEHDAGDHTIVIADVGDVETNDEGLPLVFFKGRYGTFS
jgi:flavin reductase (DIM6/NTAB) family NADH-FMN oxidoreductase RutF